MIRALYSGYTADNAELDIAKIILNANLRIESFSFQFGFDVFSKLTTDYIADMNKRSTLKDRNGNLIRGNGWMKLSDSDVNFIYNKAQSSIAGEYMIKSLISGLYGRMVWSKVMAYVRKTDDFVFDYVEEIYEHMYKIEGSAISHMNPATAKYETAELTELQLRPDEIVEAVKMTNNTDNEQTYTVSIGAADHQFTVPANSQKTDKLNILATELVTITNTGQGVFEYLLKDDDNSTYVAPVEDII